MTQKQLKNVAASVRQRLTNLSRNEGRPFQEILQYYEAFLGPLNMALLADGTAGKWEPGVRWKN